MTTNRASVLLDKISNQVTSEPISEDLTRYVYAKNGIDLYLEPHVNSPQVTHLPHGSRIELASPTFHINYNYKWFPVDFQDIRMYVSEKYIAKFPLIEDGETIESYCERLQAMNSLTSFESQKWEDRKEYKLLFPCINMRDVFLLACELYPMDFKFPKPSNKMEEVITKVDDEKDIIEEFEITRNKNGEIIMLDYIADFGNSNDTVTIRLRSDKSILLTIGNYCCV